MKDFILTNVNNDVVIRISVTGDLAKITWCRTKQDHLIIDHSDIAELRQWLNEWLEQSEPQE